ncbi:MAG TPA: MinD/ParA family protein [Planctomycetes bacterium]|nr:MinD/ParA family protein [Planctomycetota bacterium]HIN79446.1 MinD/ParA family protein [Planctomycetota bacterium]
MDQAHRLRELAMQYGEPAGARARVIAVTSGKGGVGKTNLSVGLSLAASSMGLDTVLFDCDLGLANVDLLLDLHTRYNLAHLISGQASLDEVLIPAPGGLKVLPGAAGVSRIADLSSVEQKTLIRALDRMVRRKDLIILDTGAGIGRAVIDFCVAAGEVIVVTTPEPTAIADAYATIKVLAQQRPAPTPWLVVNMAASRGEAEQVIDRVMLLSRRYMSLEVRRGGYILDDPRVPTAVRRRQHFFLSYPASEASGCVREVAKNIGLTREREDSDGGFLSRIFARWSPSPAPVTAAGTR